MRERYDVPPYFRADCAFAQCVTPAVCQKLDRCQHSSGVKPSVLDQIKQGGGTAASFAEERKMADNSNSEATVEQATSIARNIVTGLGFVAVFFGVMSAEDIAKLSGPVIGTVGGIVTIISLGSAWWSNRKSNVIKAAAKLDEVKKIEVEPAARKIAEKTKRPEVVVRPVGGL